MRLRDVSQRLVMSGIELVIDVLVINLEELLNASPFEMQRPYGVQSVYDATVEVMRTTKLPISLFKRIDYFHIFYNRTYDISLN